ncbi:hypothetical protein SAMN06295974_3833 [Plantibacter flavus]|uniref:Uncharacterized protein n=1 Tax=Plantibacter flavus TaxID=150123 RepID=A0A3N2BL65_9MICO|nr:hypothetical protein [Plantibacter flavus]ROR76021.1 hypothetical protein EDD42_3973 [Plantibacter flavus]SMG49246.1 hypothetical protein SAMN06295974_3833 [Plantibacter flavus]
MPNTTTADLYAAFPAFYDNSLIGAIADVARWTVSDSDKMPINMRNLMAGGPIWGAHEISDQCLVTLDEMTSFLPNAANNAFYLRAQTDGFVVLDIEPSCPPEVAAALLGIPSLYSELSMSGNGYHLALPLPANFWDFPIASTKRVLRHEHGWYEILLDHWVTFTRSEIPDDRRPVQDFTPGAWEALYASLAKDAVEAPTTGFDMSSERPDVPNIEKILELMTRRPLEKTLDDFRGDSSRYEFSTLGVLYNRLRPILVAMRDVAPDAVYDDGVQAWLVYEAASQLLPPRDKHEEMRNGLPLLLNAAVALVARRLGDKADEEARNTSER